MEADDAIRQELKDLFEKHTKIVLDMAALEASAVLVENSGEVITPTIVKAVIAAIKEMKFKRN